MGKDRRRDIIKANKPSTSNSIDKLTYCPKKHKQKFVKKLRQQLQSRSKEKSGILTLFNQSYSTPVHKICKFVPSRTGGSPPCP